MEPVSGSYPNPLRPGVCQTSRGLKARNRSACTSRRRRAARTTARTAPPEASRFLLPPARRCRSSPPTHGATRAVLLLLAAGRGSEQGRRWAAPVDARHAGRVPALPPPAWARSSVAPPERRGEAGCPSPVVTVEAADAARFVPPVFSSSFSGARALSSYFRKSCLHGRN